MVKVPRLPEPVHPPYYDVLLSSDVSAFMLTVLDDADAATARATLGANDAANLTTGTLPDARVSATLTADKAFRRGNILGTVSQSGGVPTGALILSGSNAGGDYVRWADGTQMCWSPQMSETIDITTAAGGGFRGALTGWTFPIAFNVAPSVTLICRSNNHLMGALQGLSATIVTPNAWRPTSAAGTSCSWQAVAVGRWF